MKKLVFTICTHSIIDTITNSSTELFVGKFNNKEELTFLLNALYPDFRSEYNDLLSIDELDIEELDNYFSYICSPHMWPATKDMYPILDGFTFDELYQVKDEGKPAWNGHAQYELRNNETNPKYSWSSRFVTSENIEEIKNKLDPNRRMFFMFSKFENPDWDMQEKLSEIMTRIHLG